MDRATGFELPAAARDLRPLQIGRSIWNFQYLLARLDTFHHDTGAGWPRLDMEAAYRCTAAEGALRLLNPFTPELLASIRAVEFDDAMSGQLVTRLTETTQGRDAVQQWAALLVGEDRAESSVPAGQLLDFAAHELDEVLTAELTDT